MLIIDHMNILLVEDDRSLGEGIRDALNREGYGLDWLKDGRNAIAAQKDNEYDVVLLDLGLPYKDGLAVLKEMRGNDITTPVLILTARNTVSDRIKGLDEGADDYLPKPFSVDELLARVRALHRRACGRAAPLLVYRDIQLDPSGHTARYKDNPVELSRREFALLNEFLEHPGRVFSRSHLEQCLYGWGEGIESNALEVHVHKLRKKFYPGLIQTVRGVGYSVKK